VVARWGLVRKESTQLPCDGVLLISTERPWYGFSIVTQCDQKLGGVLMYDYQD